jgi:hypothetical protein
MAMLNKDGSIQPTVRQMKTHLGALLLKKETHRKIRCGMWTGQTAKET